MRIRSQIEKCPRVTTTKNKTRIERVIKEIGRKEKEDTRKREIENNKTHDTDENVNLILMNLIQMSILFL